MAAACTAPATGGDELVVSAASDLALAMPELAAAFERATGIRLLVNLGSSGLLAQQIVHGAPVDVMLSADRHWIERLREAGRVADGGAAVYAYGRLALFTRDRDASVERHAAAGEVLRSLTDPAVGRLAIANPEHAPYGRAARTALERVGLWQMVHPRLVVGENIRHTVQLVQTRAADAALTALPLMRVGAGSWVLVPDSLHEPLEQTMAVIAGGAHEAAARRLMAFLLGAEGRGILARYYFVLPPESS